MELVRMPADEGAVRRYVEDLWIPYHRELEAVVDEHALAADVDIVVEEVAFRLDKLESESYRAWVAVDGDCGDDVQADRGDDVQLDRGTDVQTAPGGDVDLTDRGVELAGFVTTDVEAAPSVFDHPDRLVVGDIYVREPYRSTGLAARLVDRAAARAREADCMELTLDVDVDNERAVAFYEKLGFETYRQKMSLDVDDL